MLSLGVKIGDQGLECEWRRVLLRGLVKRASRVLLFILGFYSIAQNGAVYEEGELCSQIIICNHVSYLVCHPAFPSATAHVAFLSSTLLYACYMSLFSSSSSSSSFSSFSSFSSSSSCIPPAYPNFSFLASCHHHHHHYQYCRHRCNHHHHHHHHHHHQSFPLNIVPKTLLGVCPRMQDVLWALSYCAPAFVAKGSMAKTPLIGHLARCLGCIFVYRTRGEKGASVTADIVRRVNRPPKKTDPPILIFPEGTTTSGVDSLLTFKVGQKCEG